MNVRDHKTLASVKAIMVRQWIDTAKCQFSCTNGVLYFTGSLHLFLGARTNLSNYDYKHELLTVVKRLDRTLRQLPEVRDIVFRLDNVAKSGSRWNHI